jgi:superfamily II DNA or RNA helicase
VVRVEVLESGSDGTFGGVCTDGLVYNLVVEGTGTYAVEGVVALNCHTLPADTFWSVAMATANAAYRIGLSGTPLARGDRRSVQAIAALGPVIFRLRADALVAQGILAKPRIRMAILPQESGKPTWQGVYGELVVRSKARNAVLVEMARRCERPGLLFVKEVAHGKAIERALWAAGVRAGFVWGTHSSEYRKAMVRRLERADLDVLVCSVVFQEGIDIPSLRAVIVGSGGRSVIAAIQRVGRGTRIERNAAGEVTKDTFEVWDVADRGQDWMERAAKERRAAYLKEGYEVVEYQDVSPKPKLG